MRHLSQIAAAQGVLLVLGVLWRVMPFEVVAPLPAVVYAAYLGVSTRDRIPIAVAVAVTIGYLSDLVGGSPRGLMALVAGILCVATRAASARLLLRGRLFVATFTLVASLGASALVVGIRLLWGVPVGSVAREAIVAIGSGLATATIAPLVFRLCRAIDAAFARTARERDALREGYLS